MTEEKAEETAGTTEATADEACAHECSGCSVSDCGDRTSPADRILKPNSRSQITHVVGVVSGKGGVGKSLVTSLLATSMNRRGHRVGILDADVTGPSIPKAFGIEKISGIDESGIDPSITSSGIKVISTNLLLPTGDTPVAWRGPVISGVIRQFFNEVNWGEVDYLFVDMPPGTSDVLLTVFQTLPIDGIVTVSAPQELVAMIVGKAVNLAKDLEVEVLGLVENMAYFVCDECDKKHSVFGEPQGAEVAKRYGIPAYATLPLDPEFARMCDAGKADDYDIGTALDAIIEQIEKIGPFAVYYG
ncbi:MAG: Mrp/NBP35 family ATP-binding protein [Coriobacteriaceae bacterium]|nr:Mrp/NBP35 family ATP-binding protein [Coriobacteriaceae bacterium]